MAQNPVKSIFGYPDFMMDRPMVTVFVMRILVMHQSELSLEGKTGLHD